MSRFTLLVIIFLCSKVLNAQSSFVSWSANTTTGTFNASTFNSGVISSVSNVTRGGDLCAQNYWYPNLQANKIYCDYFGNGPTPACSYLTNSAPTTVNPAVMPYIEFSMAINGSKTINWDKFVINGIMAATSLRLDLRSSLDNYATSLGYMVVQTDPFNQYYTHTAIDISELNATNPTVSGTVKFRLYTFNNINGNGLITFRDQSSGAAFSGNNSQNTFSWATYVMNNPSAVSIWYATPTIQCSSTLSNFTKCPGVASSSQTIVVSGTNLTSSVTVGPLTGMQFSTNGTTYSTSVTLPVTGSTLANTNVYVRMSSSSTSVNSSIPITSPGATTVNKAVTGSDFTTPVITGANAVNMGTSSSYSANTSPAASNPWVSSQTSYATINSSGTLNASLPGTTTLTYTDVKSCVTTKSVVINSVPSFVLSSSLTDFSKCLGYNSPSQSFTVSGQYLTQGITITPPVGFEVSTTSTFSSVGTSSSPLVVGSSGTLIATTIYIRLSSSVNDLSYGPFNVGFATSGAANQNISVSGSNVDPIPVISNVTNGSVCGNGTVQLAAQATNGTIKWYATATGGTMLASGTTYTTTSLASTTNYYIDATVQGCTTPTRTLIEATVLPVQSLNSNTGTTATCIGNSVTFINDQSGGLWSSSASAIASINSTTGVLTGVSSGSSTITYSYVNANGCISTKTSSITISAVPSISGSTNVLTGATEQLVGSGTAASSSPWVSSNTSIGTISSTGLFSGVSNGSTIITYAANNNCSISQAVEVVNLPSITSFTPTSANPGAIITITGLNFSTSLSENIVYFGSAKGTVLTCSSSELTVSVPNGATYTNISVLVNGRIAFSKDLFMSTNSSIASASWGSTTDFENAKQITSGGHLLTTYGNNGRIIGLGDFDGDGKTDVVKGGHNAICVSRNTSLSGDISFASHQTFSYPSTTALQGVIHDLRVTDINQDGKLDVIAVTNNNNNSLHLRIFVNNSTLGNISFLEDIRINTGYSFSRVSVADMDNDGKVDIVIGVGNPRIYRNTSNPGSSPTFVSATTSIIFNQGSEVRLIDFNRDGLMDVIGPDWDGKAFLYINSSTPGSFSFQSAHSIASLWSISEFIEGDFDNNGTHDILMAGMAGANNGPHVLNNSYVSGALSSANYAMQSTGSADRKYLAAADFTGDGKLDYVSSRYGPMVLSKNTWSSGAFSSSTFSSITKNQIGDGIGLAMADLDNDGKIDAISCGSNKSNFEVWRNRIGEGPSINVSALVGFTACQGVASSAQAMTVDGYQLSNSVTVTAPTGFVISNTVNGTYGNSLSLAISGGVLNTTIYVKMISSVAGSVTGNLAFVSGSVSINEPLSGIAMATPSISGTLSIVNGTSQLLGSGTAASTSPWTSSAAGVATISSSGLVTAVDGGTSVITYTDNNSCQQTANFSVTMPLITPASNTTSLINACFGTSSIATTVGLAGANMLGAITVTPPSGFEVSINNFLTFGTNASPLQVGSSGTINTTLQIRVSSSAEVGSISGNIQLEATGAIVKTIAVSRIVYAVPTVLSSSVSSAVCGTGVVNYTATASSGAAIKWYETTTSTIVLQTASTYSPTISTTKSYFAEAYNTNLSSCVSLSRTELIGIVKPNPDGSISGANADACVNSTVNLSYSAGSNPATSLQWQISNTTSSFSDITSATTNLYNATITGSKYYSLAMTLDGCVSNTQPVYVGANQALNFDGVNDHIAFPSTAFNFTAATTKFTIEAWVRLESTPSANGAPIFTCYPYNFGNYGYYLSINSSLQVEFKRGGLIQNSGVNTIELNKWNHIAVSFSGTQKKILINGVVVSTQSDNNSINNLTAVVSHLGRRNYSTNTTTAVYFDGDIDEFKIWNSDNTSTATLLYYLNFNGGVNVNGNNSGNTIISKAGGTNNWTGTLTGFSLNNTTNTSNYVAGYGASITTNINSSTSAALFCTGASATAINVAAIGKNVAYQWYSNTTASTSSATAISGATSSSYTPSTSANGTLYYYAAVSSCSNSLNSNITGAIQVSPSVAGTISGTSSVCPGAGTTLTLTGAVGGIQWSSSTSSTGAYSPISGATSTSLSTGNLSATAYYKAQATNSSCPSATTAAYTVATTPLGTIGNITGSSTVTLGGTSTYSIPAVTNATSYVWNAPSGTSIASSTNGSSITLAIDNNFTGGTLTVQANGCGSSSIKTRQLSPISTAPTLTISSATQGAPFFCGSASATLTSSTTSPTAQASFEWTLPVGVSVASGSSLTGSSINIEFASTFNAGFVTLKRISATETLTSSYAVSSLLAPVSIQGPSTLCGLTTATYEVAAVPTATSYEWLLPTGMTGTSSSNTISTTLSGTVSGSVQVRAVKAGCGVSAWRALAVGALATPGSISGPATICGASSNTITTSGATTTVFGNTATYSISAISGATSYT
jgi:hypothetical protein